MLQGCSLLQLGWTLVELEISLGLSDRPPTPTPSVGQENLLLSLELLELTVHEDTAPLSISF